MLLSQWLRDMIWDFMKLIFLKVAKLVFKDIGKKLKDRKWRDEKELLACYLTDVIKLDQDLAENDEYLKKTLEKSSKKVT